MKKHVASVLELVHCQCCRMNEINNAKKNEAMNELVNNQMMNIHENLHNNRCVIYIDKASCNPSNYLQLIILVLA